MKKAIFLSLLSLLLAAELTAAPAGRTPSRQRPARNTGRTTQSASAGQAAAQQPAAKLDRQLYLAWLKNGLPQATVANRVKALVKNISGGLGGNTFQIPSYQLELNVQQRWLLYPFFELDTGISRQWLTAVHQQTTMLRDLRKQLNELKSTGKADTPEYGRHQASFDTTLQALAALSRKPVPVTDNAKLKVLRAKKKQALARAESAAD